jgi:hypothetical protein
MPFLLLPFRPTSDPSAARTFIRHYFDNTSVPLRGWELEQELRLTEPMVRGKSRDPEILLTVLGTLQCNEMVLEPSTRWSRYMGGI